VWTQLLLGDESAGLAEDRSQRSRVEFSVIRDRQYLDNITGSSAQLDVTPPLLYHEETELPEDADYICAGKSPDLGGMRGWFDLDGDRQHRVRRQTEGREILVLEVQGNGLTEVRDSLIQRCPLGYHRNLLALRHPGTLTFLGVGMNDAVHGSSSLGSHATTQRCGADDRDQGPPRWCHPKARVCRRTA